MTSSSSTLHFQPMFPGAINAFLVEQGMTASETATALAELVVILAHYREEGTALYPRVFLCEHLDALMKHVDARDALTLGEGPETPETVRNALKTSAPLAQGGWSTFLERQGGSLRFGVFHVDDFVLQETPIEILRRTEDPTLGVVGIVRVADDVIELCGSVGSSRYIYLSGARVDSAPPGVFSRELLASLTRDCSPAVRGDLDTFYRRVLLDVLRAVHGTLLVVVSTDPAPGNLFSDGVFLPEALDVSAAIAAYRAAPAEPVHARLQSLRMLLRGMLASDGITVLRSDGAIVGFNVFVAHAPALEGRRSGVPGGARRRTFDTLVAALGQGVIAAFYRSQDGHSECRAADATDA